MVYIIENRQPNPKSGGLGHTKYVKIYIYDTLNCTKRANARESHKIERIFCECAVVSCVFVRLGIRSHGKTATKLK